MDHSTTNIMIGGHHAADGPSVSYQDLLKHARYFCRAESDAEDAAQEAALRLYQLKKPPQESALKSYIRNTVRNVVLNTLRKQSRARNNDTQYWELHDRDNTIWSGSDPDDFRRTVEKADLVLKALEEIHDRLPPSHRDVFRLVLEGAKSKTDIARQTGLSRQTVHTAFQRIEDLIRDLGTGPKEPPDDDPDGGGNGGGIPGDGARAPPRNPPALSKQFLMRTATNDKQGRYDAHFDESTATTASSEATLWLSPTTRRVTEKEGDEWTLVPARKYRHRGLDGSAGTCNQPRRQGHDPQGQDILERLKVLLLDLPALRRDDGEGERVESLRDVLESILEDTDIPQNRSGDG